MASELHLFAKYGLEVEISREIGWATLRDKICYGELDAAHALAPLVVSMTLGYGNPPTDCLTGLVLSAEGNGITLSNRLRRVGVRDASSLQQFLRETRTPLVLAVPFLYSAHHFLLRAWLRDLGVDPERAAQVVVAPPSQMPANLKAGNLDGYCVGEPWNAVAAQAKSGWLAASSNDLMPGHPEKVLLVTRRFAEQRSEEHVALMAALMEACRYCSLPENASAVAQTLARSDYLNAPPASLMAAMGEADLKSLGRETPRPVFFGHGINQPSADKAAWIVRQMESSRLCSGPIATVSAVGLRSFRNDLHQQALHLLNARQHETHKKHETVSASF